ncbi:GrpB family protein [Brevundimonas sp. 'scallop']|nr:GrpB family protein [Brevundimonas sp. 'scallop']
MAIGYEAMGAHGIEGRRYFRKNAPDGTRTHHLHVFETGAPQIARHLAFRDYLLAFPDRAAAYSALKARIVAGPGSNGATYQDGKAAFVEELNAEAAAWRQMGRGPSIARARSIQPPHRPE